MIQTKVLIINRNQKNSFIKSLRTDNSGVAPLKKEGQLVADTKQKANILNEQFKSVFTTESIDNIPNKGASPHPDIPPQHLASENYLTTSTRIKPVQHQRRILKDLQNFTAPILTIILQKSLQTGCIPTDWKHANVAPA